MAKEHFKRAINLLGSQTAVAEACGVTQQTVSHWLNKAKTIPAEAALDIERATEGQITRAELRPDLFEAAAA